jgi:hypothetical protein
VNFRLLFVSGKRVPGFGQMRLGVVVEREAAFGGQKATDFPWLSWVKFLSLM